MIDIDKFKLRLEDKLRELTARAEEIDEDLSEPPDSDWQENAVEAADDEVLEEIGDVTLEDIRQIRLALGRIEAGTYGVCVRCGNEIAQKRLEAIPHALKCIECA